MWHWSGMLIQIISVISANYNCQCGGHRLLAENIREQFGLGNTPSPKNCSSQRKTISRSPTHHFKNSLWWTQLSQPAALFLCAHRPQSNYNLLGWNYSKNDHIFLLPLLYWKWFGEIWTKLLLAENIIIHIYKCVLVWPEEWFKMQHIVSN